MKPALRLVPSSPVDTAWEAYRALRARELADPALMVDRAHCEAVALAYQHWNRLFLGAAR